MEINGGSSWTRPSTATDSANNRSDTVLVNSYTFNDAGLIASTTDPKGIINNVYYDAAGRTIKTIDDYTGSGPTASSDQTTEYTYDGDDDVLTMKADLPSSAFQTTAYIYGVTTTGGSYINSNDILAKIEYPDLSSGSASTSSANDVSYLYNAAGQQITMTDQNGNVHAYSYDPLGRLTVDNVTTLGSGVDGSIRKLTYNYNTQGLAYQQTSYDGSNAVVNQVQDAYNGLGQLITQYQAVSGSVNTSTTPKVQYTYADPSLGSRLTEMIYPNGRIEHYYYNTGIDTTIGRLSGIADDDGSGGVGTHLEEYSYLGLDTIVQENRPQPGIELTYLQQSSDSLTNTDGGDEVTGLNRFGEVIDQNWINTSTGASTDRFQYAYDRDGNVLYKNNLVDPSLSELYHANSTTSGDDSTAYDNLNRLVAFSRGTLTSSGNNGTTLDTVTTGNLSSLAGSTQSWSLNNIGDQSSVTTDGTTVNNTTNSQNEETGVGSATLTFDSAGNMTTDQNGNTYKYDAWNHLIQVKNSGGTTIATYSYDASGNRVTQTESSTTTYFYLDSSNGNIIEERVSGTVTNQYVWGIAYTNELIVRDDNSTSGNLGISGSGLGRRLYDQFDANWNITTLVSSGGTVEQRFIYSPYGIKLTLNAAGTSTVTDAYTWLYTFQEGRFDTVTGLIHFGARDYDPSTGTWREEDPDQYVNGPNMYQMEVSNPIANSDPFGTQVDDDGDGKDAPPGSDPTTLEGQIERQLKDIEDEEKLAEANGVTEDSRQLQEDLKKEMEETARLLGQKADTSGLYSNDPKDLERDIEAEREEQEKILRQRLEDEIAKKTAANKPANTPPGGEQGTQPQPPRVYPPDGIQQTAPDAPYEVQQESGDDDDGADESGVIPRETPYTDPQQPNYNNGATHMDHEDARVWGGRSANRALPAETNMRRGGFDGALYREYQDLITRGMSEEDARAAVQSEIDALKNSPPPRPMDPDILDELPSMPE